MPEKAPPTLAGTGRVPTSRLTPGPTATNPGPGPGPTGGQAGGRSAGTAFAPTEFSIPAAVVPTGGLTEGEVLGGRYRVGSKIGGGAMGEVWEAQHLVIGKTFAVKVLAPEGGQRADRDEMAERLMREAKAVAVLDHPHIVDITDFGHTTKGDPYFVMERLHGVTLKDVVKREGPLPWSRALRLLGQVADALAHAHEKGIVHRDLKPENVFVLGRAPQQRCMLIDFGIAKLTVLDEEAQKFTRTGIIFGSPAFMPPEQAQGAAIDARADVYAFGCSAFWVLTGRFPFEADNATAMLYKHMVEPPPRLEQVHPQGEFPAGLEAVVARCLEKDPANRYQSMLEVRDVLTRLETPSGNFPGLASGVHAAASSAALSRSSGSFTPASSASMSVGGGTASSMAGASTQAAAASASRSLTPVAPMTPVPTARDKPQSWGATVVVLMLVVLGGTAALALAFGDRLQALLTPDGVAPTGATPPTHSGDAAPASPAVPTPAGALPGAAPAPSVDAAAAEPGDGGTPLPAQGTTPAAPQQAPGVPNRPSAAPSDAAQPLPVVPAALPRPDDADGGTPAGDTEEPLPQLKQLDPGASAVPVLVPAPEPTAEPAPPPRPRPRPQRPARRPERQTPGDLVDPFNG